MPNAQLNNVQMKELLAGEFQRSADPSFMARIVMSKYELLPGLRGFWQGELRNDTAYGGVPYITDCSNNGYHLATADAPILYTNPREVGFWQFNGTTQTASIADNTHFDILGTEAFIAHKGISMGCWILPSRARPYAGAEELISKYTIAGNQMAYRLILDSANPTQNGLTGILSQTGANTFIFDHSKVVAQNKWYFFAMTFNVASYYGEAAGVRLWVNDVLEYHAASDRGTAGLPASIFNSTSGLYLSSYNGIANWFQGYGTLWWICGNYLNEAAIFNLYETSKYIIGGYVNEKGTAW